MQVSVAAPHEVLNGGAGAPTAQPTYVLAGANPQVCSHKLTPILLSVGFLLSGISVKIFCVFYK